MSRGLDSFDRFAWKSLLAGREALVCDADRPRGLRTVAILERAGARATLAETPTAAADRLLRHRFALHVVMLDVASPFADVMGTTLRTRAADCLALAEPERREAVRGAYPGLLVRDMGTPERDLVMAIVGARDE
ncbi:hypothetical protein [Aurantimonas sp. Leaf443]|uniref:hypothetical protein n=1 Tax=Aurantimonas sp. Leaf443 TaxID=1736378 RepID=UPI0006FB039C|nr:hypothetical protein [Aurantimonas sp. Leaf443]KQT86038.1 hypothetical protein ASG48_05485 [Aurantimonas sp. Leaf443]